ncbi:GNAT family N-acetyltransferase [Litoreibacter roseus]|uniref:N-acetyltransferase domain-containing protein n=1 Tax=Litoreibacter roseus TaxID=2601869 RepID=A0A6N6JI13_9RHOB|nr:GNAT family N-acetyltransferase [Litoreibacter roseus]GFE66013.1 hypothetical protein KIN_30870 [Litoreibacter roseus]
MTVLRPLNTADLAAVAKLQTNSWGENYANVLPPDYLSGPMQRDIAARWAKGLTETDLVLGAFDPAGDLSGFIAIKLIEPAPYIDNLHIRRDAWGQGLATRLMSYAAARLSEMGHDAAWLTVLDTNIRARALYSRLGGKEGPPGPDEMFGQAVVSCPVHWTDLRALAQLGGSGEK